MKARLAASIVLTVGLAVGVSGCTLITNQDTVGMKESSVGVGGTTGSIDVRDAVIVAGSAGHLGNLVTTLVNNDGTAQAVEVQHGSTTKVVMVPAYGVKKVGQTTRVQFTDLGARPGSLTEVYFTTAGETGVRLQVPVLATDYPGFEDYAPKVQVVVPVPIATPGATGTATPAP